MSDSSMDRPSGVVVGTAGHIDHGKTALVRALTGIDTDRLAEEKRRGISIDLGFAHLALPNGRTISFVDVPGHERFVKNMLAGAAGIQAVLLVVAANESVKPQTREHLDICRLLAIRSGIIVLTKIDLAGAEQIRKTCEEVRALCAGSFLDAAPAIAVSATTDQGLDELKAELSLLIERIPPRDDSGLARLPIDRSFALRGFGTVVTGTLCSGKLRVGDSVQLHPADRQLRIRGLQVHGTGVDSAIAGQRLAVNLSGIESSEIRRGYVLTHSSALEMTKLIDVSVEWLESFEVPRKREHLLLHIGTAEVFAAIKILHTGQGSQMLARLWLSETVLALPGDRFVLRQPSPAHTVAGGLVIDPFPPARLNRAKTIGRLQILAEADLARRVQLLVEESATGRGFEELVRLTGAGETQLRSIIGHNPSLVSVDSAQRIVTKAWIAEKRRKLVNWLAAFHTQHSSAAGAPIALARLGLDPQLATAVFDGFPAIRVQGDIIALANHKAQFSNQESRTLAKIEGAFRQAGFKPPPAKQVLESTGTDSKQARALLEALIKSRTLVRISEDLIFHTDAITHIRKSLSGHKGRKFSVPEFKEWTQISRKYAIPLLEYLDRERVTRRDGDARVVL
ncbi:MAG: selenocysteine-specific translation elongation factor [Bryobacteraceae bacterium]